MSRDPDGRINVCERCRRDTELTHSPDLDEYLCEECIALPRCACCGGFMPAPGWFNDRHGEFWCKSCVDNENTCLAEDAYERQCEDFHDGGSTAPWPETVRLQQIEARKLK